MPPKGNEQRRHVPVCAIGASAGGVVAIKDLFRHLPEDLGLAYVVILHLAPDQPSALDQILAGVTGMPVAQVTDSATLRPDRVYLIAPDRELFIEGDEVRARPFTEPRGRRAPIDMFFRSVARGRGDGLAVILSGTGSDGAMGVRDIKEGGGVVFVREPKSAEFAMMPRSALAAGVADFVAPIPKLAERMVEVARSKEAVRSLPAEPVDQVLQRVVGFLRSRTGHDFSSYKRATVLRRVTRRMQVTRRSDIADYLDYLVANPEEAQELFGDLLISVTAFFRDPDAYQALAQKAIGPIFDEVAGREQKEIRAWVAGCATGEEAYSLAILFLEEAARRNVVVPIQIFATDLDEGALATAREGRYPASIAADVSEERLHAFFVAEGAHYRVRKEVRDAVLFAEHSVLKDPPFMRLDLISCRNLLIYLDRQVQHQVSALFAYGLKPHGLLFLGSAETVDAAGDLFAPVDRDARIYRARPQASRRLPVMARMPAEHRPDPVERRTREKPEEREFTVRGAHLEALEEAAPPSVLVDREYRVLNLSERAGRFLMPSGGPLSTEITALVRPELRLDLRTAVRRAIDSGESTLTAPLPVAFNGGHHRVSMFVSPGRARGDEAGEALVVFLDGGPIETVAAPAGGEASSDEVRRLRDELASAEARLSASKAEHENAIQDLRVANEELQSINEEYRSTSEELETSKEELQSMNEELRTVNAELKSKLESIGAAHSDLENLVAATDVGTLFLDPRLRIRMFTPRVAQVFNITEVDVGRPITDFSHHLVYDGLPEDARHVMRDLVPVEHEVAARGNRWFMVRLRPYRTADDRIDGVVVTFVDVTDWREATRRLEENEARQSFLLALSDALRPLRDPAEIEGEACRRLAERFDVDRAYYVEVDEAAGLARVRRDFVRRGAPSLAGTHRVSDFQWSVEILRRDECHVVEDTRTSPLVPEKDRPASEALGIIACMGAPVIKDGRLVGALCVTNPTRRPWTASETEVLREVADRLWSTLDRERVATALADSGARYRALFGATSEVVYRMSPDWSEMRELQGRGFLADTERPDTAWPERYIPEEDRPGIWEAIRAATAGNAAFELEHRVLKADGTAGWVLSRAVPIRDAAGHVVEWFGAAADMTERHAREEALRRTRDELALATEAAQVGWGTWDVEARTATWDARAREIIGLGEDESGIADFMDRVHPDDRAAFEAEVEASLAEGRAFDREYRVVHRDGTERTVHGSGVLQRREAGVRGTGLVRDVTDLRRWEANQRMLLAELNHRVKNMLAVVISIANQTRRSSADMEGFTEAFTSRLQSLSRSHAVLTRANWEGADLRDLVEEEAGYFASGDAARARIGGPAVRLGPNAALSLSLALHELGTNAVKYGAWSVPEGRVGIDWSRTADGAVALDWTESGGPEVVAPARTGFGSRLLNQGIARELGGDVSIEYDPRGVRCRIHFNPWSTGDTPQPEPDGRRG